MNNADARKMIDQAIAAATFAGDKDAVARLEIAREYFFNAEFRAKLATYIRQKEDHDFACAYHAMTGD